MGKMTASFSMATDLPETSSWNPALGLARLDHDETLMGEIVQLLEHALTDRLEAMQACAASNDFNNLRQHTHAELPSLKILGFDPQAQVFEAFESAVLMNDQMACARLSPLVEKIWMDTIRTLAAYTRAVAL